jgi:hypothetical protein
MVQGYNRTAGLVKCLNDIIFSSHFSAREMVVPMVAMEWETGHFSNAESTCQMQVPFLF